jgi:hypothetical protein
MVTGQEVAVAHANILTVMEGEPKGDIFRHGQYDYCVNARGVVGRRPYNAPATLQYVVCENEDLPPEALSYFTRRRAGP